MVGNFTARQTGRRGRRPLHVGLGLWQNLRYATRQGPLAAGSGDLALPVVFGFATHDKIFVYLRPKSRTCGPVGLRIAPYRTFYIVLQTYKMLCRAGCPHPAATLPLYALQNCGKPHPICRGRCLHRPECRALPDILSRNTANNPWVHDVAVTQGILQIFPFVMQQKCTGRCKHRPLQNICNVHRTFQGFSPAR